MKQSALQALQHVRTTLAYQITPEAVSELLEPIQRVLEADEQGGKTGWPAGLLQDDCRELSNWFASRPDARLAVREVCYWIIQSNDASNSLRQSAEDFGRSLRL